MTTAEIAFIALALGGFAAYWSRVLGGFLLGASVTFMTAYSAGITHLFHGRECESNRIVDCNQPAGQAGIHHLSGPLKWAALWVVVCVAAYLAARKLRQLRFPR